MKKTYVFLDNKVIGEYIGNLPKFTCPMGAYVRYENNHWYYKTKVSLVPINLSDIPPCIKAICLLMGISI